MLDDWSGEGLCWGAVENAGLDVTVACDWSGEGLCWGAVENTELDVTVGYDADGVGCEKAVMCTNAVLCGMVS